IMGASHAEALENLGVMNTAIAVPRFALALRPAAFLLDPIKAFRQPVGIHHQVVVGEGWRPQQVGASHGEGIKAEFPRHLVDETFEGKADVYRAMAAESAAWRGIGENAPAHIFHVV